MGKNNITLEPFSMYNFEIIKQGLDETVTDSGKELKLQGYILRNMI